MKRILTLGSFLVVFLLTASPAHAFSLGDIGKSIGNFFSSLTTPHPTNGNLTVTGDIKLAKNGDVNNNGVIDGGDMVTFSYTISNLSTTDYPYTVLKTNIQRNDIYYINNVRGAYSVDEKGNTVSFTNLYVHAHQVIHISFDAHVLFTDKTDLVLTTQPQLFTKDKKNIGEDIKKELQTKHNVTNKFPAVINTKKNK